MNLRILFFLLTLSTFKLSLAQTCSISINSADEFLQRNFKQEMSMFFSLEFEINGTRLKSTDTLSAIIDIKKTGFDFISYTYVEMNGKMIHDSFICKLKPGETYSISPCTCCGIFLMTPSKNAKRGFVKFNNNSLKEFTSVVSEFDYDTIPKNSSTAFTHSSISMNCGFRPNKIFIADIDYLNEKFSYINWSAKTQEEKETLLLEQDSLIIYSFNFLFLHEEKLIITINEFADEFKVFLE